MNDAVKHMILALQGNMAKHGSGASAMPFPNNHNPNTDFNNRFPVNMPTGITNDLRQTTPDIPLQRKLNWQ